jgi:hypothetical protein
MKIKNLTKDKVAGEFKSNGRKKRGHNEEDAGKMKSEENKKRHNIVWKKKKRCNDEVRDKKDKGGAMRRSKRHK